MGIRQRITNYVNFQRTVRELSQLDNAQLKDLGINRDQIRHVARGGSVL